MSGRWTRTWSNDDLKFAVKESTTIADVLRKLELSVSPGNYRTVQKYIEYLGLDANHFTGRSHGKSIPRHKRSLTNVLTRKSTYATYHLGPRLIKDGILKDECALCHTKSWKGKKLRLVLDHINGIHDDHRASNLRLLCPNCNSQQPTFCRGIKGISGSLV